MASDHSGPFFRSLVDILQGFSRNLVDHSHCVEISGYICVEIDHWKKEKYVLNEVVRRNGSAHSKSRCFDIQTTSRKVSECCHASEPLKVRFDVSSMPKETTGISANRERGDSRDGPATDLDPPAEPGCMEEGRPHLRIQQAASPDSMSCDTVAVKKKSTRSKQVKQAPIPTSLLLSCIPSSEGRRSSRGSEFTWAIGLASDNDHDESDSRFKIPEQRCSKRRLQTENTEDVEPVSDASLPKHQRRISEVNRPSGNEVWKAELHRIGFHNDDKVSQRCSVHLEATPLLSINASKEVMDVSASCGTDGEEVGSSARERTHATTSMDMNLHVDNDVIFCGKGFENGKLPRSSACVSSSKLDCQARVKAEEEKIALPVHVKPVAWTSVNSDENRFGLGNGDDKVPDSSAQLSGEAHEAKDIGCSNIDTSSFTTMDSMVNTADSNTFTDGTSERNMTHSGRYSRGKCVAGRFQKFHLEKTGRDVDLLKTSPKELNMLLLEYFSEVKKVDGGELKPKTLKGMFEHLAFYMKENGYPCSITTDEHFQTSKDYMKRKQQGGEVFETELNSSIDVHDLEVLLRSNYFGPRGPGPLTSSMWFMNSQFLGITQASQHVTLRWGDIRLKTDEQKREYLERLVEGKTTKKLYAKPRNPNRCFVSFYKQFRDLRPAESLVDNSPFYLAYRESGDVSSFLPEALSSRKLGVLWPRLLSATGLPKTKKIINHWLKRKPSL